MTEEPEMTDAPAERASRSNLTDVLGGGAVGGGQPFWDDGGTGGTRRTVKLSDGSEVVIHQPVRRVREADLQEARSERTLHRLWVAFVVMGLAGLGLVLLALAALVAKLWGLL